MREIESEESENQQNLRTEKRCEKEKGDEKWVDKGIEKGREKLYNVWRVEWQWFEARGVYKIQIEFMTSPRIS